jgi:hypothetical protein
MSRLVLDRAGKIYPTSPIYYQKYHLGTCVRMASVLALVVIMGTYMKKLISFVDLVRTRARGRPTWFCWQPAVSEMGHFWKRGASGAEIPRINN